MTTNDSHATADELSPAESAASVGTVAGLVGALPLVGPALVAGCLSCVGVGAAAGLSATSALPPPWWVAGYGTVGLGVAVAESRRAQRCLRQPALARTLLVLIAVAAASWLATRYLVVPATDWLTGPDPPPSDGPILP